MMSTKRLAILGGGSVGAEMAQAWCTLGSQVTLISSRDRVLPHEDPDAAMVVEDVFRRRGMTVLGRSRADGVKREGTGVVVTLADGRTVRGSHCLLTVGLVPATQHLGLEDAGVTLDERGFVTVDKVSRTSAAARAATRRPWSPPSSAPGSPWWTRTGLAGPAC